MGDEAKLSNRIRHLKLEPQRQELTSFQGVLHFLEDGVVTVLESDPLWNPASDGVKVDVLSVPMKTMSTDVVRHGGLAAVPV